VARSTSDTTILSIGRNGTLIPIHFSFTVAAEPTGIKNIIRIPAYYPSSAPQHAAPHPLRNFPTTPTWTLSSAGANQDSPAVTQGM
jgi:hypothetical protein